MHEMSLMESVIDAVNAEVKNKHLGKVTKIRLKVGKLAAVEPEALSFCYEALVSGAELEKAKLEILETSGLAKCKICDETFEISRYGESCPVCGCSDIEIIEGDRVLIQDIEVENEDV